MSLKLHYINGQWRAFEAPEKSDPGYDAFIAENAHYKKQRDRQYKKALDDAAKNSLPVLNEELITGMGTVSVSTLGETVHPVPGKYYDWPGSYEKMIEYYCTEPGCSIPNRCLHQGKPTLCGQESKAGYVLTLPAPVKEEDEGTFGNLKFKVGSILSEEFLKWNDGKFHSAIELNPATHALTEFFSSELSKKDEEIKEIRKALIDKEAEVTELSVEYIYPLIKCLSEMVDWIAEETPEVKEKALDIINKTNKRLKLRGQKPNH